VVREGKKNRELKKKERRRRRRGQCKILAIQ
jgi:hypothetical protein